jgi:hypothetical protein
LQQCSTSQTRISKSRPRIPRKCELITLRDNFYLTTCYLFFSIHNRSDDAWEAQTKISFAEHQIQLCESVNSPLELKHWYATLGYYLASHGNEKKVRQVLDELLGPIYSLQNDAECRAKHKILNIDKHELLREVLSSFHSSTKWQRIYCEYLDQLNEMQPPAKMQKMDTTS